jgi:hypothetical protein
MLPNGEYLADSWSICAYSGLKTIEDPSLQALLDDKIGPLARQLAYSFILKPSNKNIWQGLCTNGRHWFWRLLWWLGLGSFVSRTMTKYFKPNDIDVVSKCREDLKAAVAELDAIISTRKGKFISGDTIGVADVAAAALLAPVVLPRLYCKGEYNKWFDLIEQQDPMLAAEAVYWRGTNSGAFCLELYEKFRE